MAYTDTDELDQDQLNQLPLRPPSIAGTTSLTGPQPISLAMPQGIAPAPSGGSITGEAAPLMPPPAPKSITDGLLGGANPLVAQPTMKENLAALEAEPSPLSQRHGFTGTLENIADVLGSSFAPNIAQNIPGTIANREKQIDRAQQQALAEQKLIPEEDWKQVPDTNFEINSKTGETRPMGGVNIPAKEEKPGEYKAYTIPGQTAPVLATQVGNKLLTRDGQELPANATPYEKPGAPHVETPHPGMVNGKPAWGVLTDKGWIDPNTQKAIPNFEPQPSFAETGLWEPTMMVGPDGGMVPAAFNRRTAQTIPLRGGTPAAIPAEAQKVVEQSLDAARQAETRWNVMNDNKVEALKGDQQAMLSLVANHIGMTLGLQKGARINQAVWNEAVTSAPWLARVASKFDDQGYLSGVTLAPDQINQMVNLATERRTRQWQQAQSAAQQYGVPNAVKPPDDVVRQLAGGANEPPKAEPRRPANVPAGFKWNANGPKGAGWYR